MSWQSRLIVLIAALTLIACSETVEADHPGAPAVDWDSPLHGGLVVKSVEEAQQYVKFSIVVPEIGLPDLIEVDDPEAIPPGDRVVAFVFHLSEEGTVIVEESVSRFGQADLQERANLDNAPAAAFQMVDVGSDKGLLITGDGIGRLRWISSDGVLLDIVGPSITPDQVLGLGQKVEADIEKAIAKAGAA